ncbi:hypothetical protein W911_06880 [Hyphomicrobium nitrativorans NL23]|uniref:Uncharacterized protein n=1 Tax=Hyphomicrobium nitrativorans NL23 TaxID=1029756 RepID=V5SJD0_9HYPH|nr:hypothetical protein [Hyphomicrobium nitrativorans]AHB50064.1 hypothetical protein W911_06880 [Hyphomicrobium nitrativorans NL23]
MSIQKAMAEVVAREGAAQFHTVFSEAALGRATRAYVAFVGADEECPGERVPFAAGYVLGVAEALRRAAIALTDPRSRGVEAEVVRLLAEGLDIEDALRKASAPPEPKERVDAVVVALRPRAAAD